MRDPVALLLAQQDLAREVGSLRIVGEQVAQQQRGRAGRCGRTPRTGQQLRIGLRRAGHITCDPRRPRRLSGRVHKSFTRISPSGNRRTATVASLRSTMELTEPARSCWPASWRSGRRAARRGGGRALPSRCASSSLLAALRAQARARRPARGAVRDGVGCAAATRRPLRRRLRPQAACQAGRCRTGPASSTPTSGSATGCDPSLHTLFTTVTTDGQGWGQDDN